MENPRVGDAMVGMRLSSLAMDVLDRSASHKDDWRSASDSTRCSILPRRVECGDSAATKHALGLAPFPSEAASSMALLESQAEGLHWNSSHHLHATGP
jgi:hypothetical protein